MMKNARTYEKKVKKLLAGMAKGQQTQPIDDAERPGVLVESVLGEDASADQVDRAMSTLREEFVDFNELRVSPLKEVVEQLGRDYPEARDKAEMLNRALNGIFERSCAISMRYMEKMTKRDLRRHLQEIGLSPYAAACVVLQGFGGHAIPVDESLVECLGMEGYIHPDSDVLDLQGFLERIIPQRNALVAHEFFRKYVRKHARALAARRRAKARAEAARRKAEAEAAARAEAERLAAEAAREKREAAKAAARKKKARRAKVKKVRKAAKRKVAAKARKAKKARQAKRARKAKQSTKTMPKK